MTKHDLNRYAKRIQSRLSNRGYRYTLEQCRQALINHVGENVPSEIDLVSVTGKLTNQAQSQEKKSTELATVEATASEIEETIEQSDLEIPQPEISEDLSEHPDIAPLLNPQQDDAWSEPESALTKSEPGSPLETVTNELVQQKVEQTFSSQPVALKEQILNYSTEQTFQDAEELEEFLENLRAMEFEVLLSTLKAHCEHRGAMLNVLTGVIDEQQKKDSETRKKHRQNYQDRLNQFNQHMGQRLATNRLTTSLKD